METADNKMDKDSKKGKRNLSQDSEIGATNVKVGKRNPNSSGSSFLVPNHLSVQSSPEEQNGVEEKLDFSFYDIPCISLAQSLLGKYIVRSIGSQRIRGCIVETEAYMGPEDKAAHSYQGKKTPRNEAMFMKPGTSYVYNIYGMYCCLNISSQGDGSAVLIRALEPIEGPDLMAEGRRSKTDKKKKPLKQKELSNGPSKLCQALHISKNDFDKTDLTVSDSLWLENGPSVDDEKIISCPRINIGYADDWKEKPLRFYVMGNSCVSVRDKKAEKLKTEALQVDGKSKT